VKSKTGMCLITGTRVLNLSTTSSMSISKTDFYLTKINLNESKHSCDIMLISLDSATVDLEKVRLHEQLVKANDTYVNKTMSNFKTFSACRFLPRQTTHNTKPQLLCGYVSP